MPDGANGGVRRTGLLAAGIVALCACAAAALHVAGRAAREPRADERTGAGGPPIVTVRTTADAIAAWRARGLRGRTLVHAGRFLHFVAVGSDVVVPALAGRGSGAALDDALVRGATPRNYLWTAASLGIARRVLYVMPPAALEQRLATLGAGRRDLPLRLGASDAISRTLLADLPATEEPVVLDVNASWFDEGTPADLLTALDASGLRLELVTLDLAEDADDVGDDARARLRALERALLERRAARAGAPE